MATATLASDLSFSSKKPEPDNSVSTSEVYSWGSQLASESRKLDWVLYWYVWPDAVSEMIYNLETMNGGGSSVSLAFWGWGIAVSLLNLSQELEELLPS